MLSRVPRLYLIERCSAQLLEQGISFSLDGSNSLQHAIQELNIIVCTTMVASMLLLKEEDVHQTQKKKDQDNQGRRRQLEAIQRAFRVSHRFHSNKWDVAHLLKAWHMSGM